MKHYPDNVIPRTGEHQTPMETFKSYEVYSQYCQDGNGPLDAPVTLPMGGQRIMQSIASPEVQWAISFVGRG